MRKTKVTIGLAGILVLLAMSIIINSKYRMATALDLEMTDTVPLQINEKLLPLEVSRERVDDITHVVMHFMSNVSYNQKEPYNLENICNIFIEADVSAHYLIDRNGEVYSLVDENRVAYQAGRGTLDEFPEYTNKLNDYSIGIELMAIGSDDEMEPIIGADKVANIPEELKGYTEAQYTSLNKLLDDILIRNQGIVKDRIHIIGHDEYNPEKTDPGKLFDWSKIGL